MADVSIALAAVGPSACGGTDPALPPSCAQTPERIESALARAPGPVALADGTRLSQCVARARSDADLQSLGSVLTAAADQLAARAGADGAASLQLGYLVGASRRGARHTGGVSDELVRHLEQSAAGDHGPQMAAALHRGLVEGERSG